MAYEYSWLLETREANGTWPDAEAALGTKRQDPNDPDTMAAIRKQYEERHERDRRAHAELLAREAAAAARRGPIGRFFAGLTGGKPPATRRLEGETLEDYAASLGTGGPPPIILPYAPECEDGAPSGDLYVLEAPKEQFFAFDLNLIVEHSLITDEDEGTQLFLDTRLRTPAEIAALADLLQSKLDAFRQANPEPDPDEPDEYQSSIQEYESCIRWLRFWGPKGFPILVQDPNGEVWGAEDEE